MSKFFKISVAVLLLICSLLSFCSCASRPLLDLKEAAENLEDEGYVVTYNDDAEDSDPSEQEYLYAYGDSDDRLVITVFTHSRMATLRYESLKMSYENNIDSIKLQIETLKYEIKKYGDDLDDDELDELEDELDELEDELEYYKEDYCIGKSGKTVWYGTKDAIKDSKG